MHKKVLLIFSFFIISCKSQIKVDNIETLKQDIFTEFKVCEPCTENLNTNLSSYLIEELNKSYKTTVFHNLELENQIVFSFCNDTNTQKNEYFDCFDIIKFRAKNNTANKIYSHLEKIYKKTIYFKPPSNWVWLKKKDNIFLIYSMYYGPHENEFKKVTTKVKSFLFIQ